MTLNLEINLEICTKCGLCEKACSLRTVKLKDNYPIERPFLCNSCGHCAAICPVDAIQLKNSDMNNFKPIQEHKINYEQLFNLVRNRKSIRNYQEKPISEEDIEKIIESVRYIPTGANRQPLKYNVITNPEMLHKITVKVAKKITILKRLTKLSKPFVPKFEYHAIMNLMDLWKTYEKTGYKGFDVFLQDTPCLIVIYAKTQRYVNRMLNQWEAGIACYNLILTAETLGIGTQLLGYVALTAKVCKSINKVCMVPKKHKILAALILGYPDIKYLKTVDRRELDVKRY